MNKDEQNDDEMLLSKIEKKDFSLEAKIKNILEGDNQINLDFDEFKVTSFNFNGMIHDNITPKDYDKECNLYFIV